MASSASSEPNNSESTWSTGIPHLDGLWKINDARTLRIVKGPPGTGKSELLHQLALSCILPKEKNGIRFGGNESIVVFFSNDHKFSLSRIVHLYYQRLIASASASLNSTRMEATGVQVQDNDDPNQTVDSVLQECLSRLWVVRCKDPLQLRVSLAALPRRLATIEKQKQRRTSAPQTSDSNPPVNPRVTLIMDSIDTFSLVDSKYMHQHEPLDEIVKQWLYATPNSMAFAACSDMSHLSNSTVVGSVLALNGAVAESGDSHRPYIIDPSTGFCFT